MKDSANTYSLVLEALACPANSTRDEFEQYSGPRHSSKGTGDVGTLSFMFWWIAGMGRWSMPMGRNSMKLARRDETGKPTRNSLEIIFNVLPPSSSLPASFATLRLCPQASPFPLRAVMPAEPKLQAGMDFGTWNCRLSCHLPHDPNKLQHMTRMRTASSCSCLGLICSCLGLICSGLGSI